MPTSPAENYTTIELLDILDGTTVPGVAVTTADIAAELKYRVITDTHSEYRGGTRPTRPLNP